MVKRSLALTRRFSTFSLLFILLAGTVLAMLVRQHELQQLEALVEERNVVMTQVFLNVLSDDIRDLVSETDSATQQANYKQLEQTIASLIQGSDIAKLKIYNLAGLVVFSTDPTQLGEDKSGNSGFNLARLGNPNSELTHRKQFSSTEGEKVDVDLVASYIPMHQAGTVFGVIELYQDVTRPLAAI